MKQQCFLKMKFITIILTVIFSLSINAQDSNNSALKSVISIGVLPFKISGAVTSSEVGALNSALCEKMKSDKIIVLTDNEKIVKAINDQQMNEPECFKIEKCLVKIGNSLDVDFLIWGSIEESYGIVTLTLQQFDVFHKELWEKTVDISSKSSETTLQDIMSKNSSELALKMYAKRPPPKPTVGVICVSTEPNGALVVLDNTKQNGVTPLNLLKIVPGKHEIKVIRDSVAILSKVDVKAGDTIKLNILMSAQVNITSSKAGATIFFDSKNVGSAPVTLNDVIPGTHVIRSVTEDSSIAEQKIKLNPGDTAQVDLVLKSTLGSLSIVTSSVDAQVFIDSVKLAASSPFKLDRMKPGVYTIRAIASDSSYAEQKVDIRAGDVTNVKMILKSIKAVLEVSTVPPGADVYLDSVKLVGISPITIPRLDPGKYRVYASNKDSAEAWQQIDVKAGDTMKLNLDLKATKAILIVSTTPAGASVYLDSAKMVGGSPLTISKLKPGKYKVYTVNRDSSEAQQIIDLKAGDTTRLHLALKPTKATLFVSTIPTNATVYLDSSRFTSASPLTIPRLIPGTYTVRAVSKDSAEAKQQITLKAGDSARVKLILNATKATLTISTNPQGAIVTLDSVLLSKLTPVTIQNLKPGIHKIHVITRDSSEANQEVDLKAGDNAVVKIPLRSKRSTISVNTSPIGAIVYIDTMRLLKVSPVSLNTLPAGTYLVRAVDKDSALAEQSVTIGEGDSVHVKLMLKPSKSVLIVNTIPAGAKLFVDSIKQKAISPTIIKIRRGNHIIRAVGNDSAEAIQEIVGIGGDTIVLKLQLSKKMTENTVNTAPQNIDTVKQILKPSITMVRMSLEDTVSSIEPSKITIDTSVSKQVRAQVTVKTISDDADSTSLNKVLSDTIQSVKILVDSTKVLKSSVKPIPGLTMLVIESTPTGAKAFLDSDELPELTPTTLLGMPKGTHKIFVVKDDLVGDTIAELIEGGVFECQIALKKKNDKSLETLSNDEKKNIKDSDNTSTIPIKSDNKDRPVSIQIVTNPESADVYIETSIKKSTRPVIKTPDFLKNKYKDQSSLLIVKTGYRDTVVLLRSLMSSSVIDLVPADKETIARQAIRDSERNQFNIGLNIFYSSGVLLAGSVISYLFAEQDYKDATDAKMFLEHSMLDRSSAHYNDMIQENKEKTNSGKTKTIIGTSLLVFGAGMLGTSFILLF